MSPQVVKDVFHDSLLMFAYTPSKSRWFNSMQLRKEFWGITRKFERAVLFLDVNPRLKSKQVKVSVFALNMALSTILPDFSIFYTPELHVDTGYWKWRLANHCFFNYGYVIFLPLIIDTFTVRHIWLYAKKITVTIPTSCIRWSSTNKQQESSPWRQVAQAPDV